MTVNIWINCSSIRDIRTGSALLFALFLMFSMGCGRSAYEPGATTIPTAVAFTPESLSSVIRPTPELLPAAIPTTAIPKLESTPTPIYTAAAPTPEPTSTAQTPEEETDSETQSYSQPEFTGGEHYFGQSLLKERINYADIIARVKLRSVTPTAAKYVYESNGFEFYTRAILFNFGAIEYLKGSGGSELMVIVPDNANRYGAERDALDAASRLVSDRDTRWDSRQAIVFIQESEKPLTNHRYRFVFGGGSLFTLPAYMIDSKYNKTWLPAASESGASGQADRGYAFSHRRAFCRGIGTIRLR